ncbi:MAG: InlB B-repeat-containing protein, partial [Prevotella sp.]|nr:InlB B-repeat-containing protein [Prevotella sp.]
KGTSQVVVTVVAGTGISSVSPSGIVSVLYGDALPLSCVAAVGYFFDHWLQDGSEVSRQQNFTLYNITSNTTLTAVGIENTTEYTVAIITNAPGVTSVSGAGRYRVGTQQTINCVVASGYSFVAWTENNALGEVISNSNPFTLVVNRDITLYPLCEAEGGDSWFMYFAIQQPSWGHIEDNDDPPSVFNDRDWYEFSSGEAKEFIAVPASGYEFVKWLFNGENFSGNTRRQITWDFDETTDADGTLTAVFQVQTTPTNTLHLMVSQRFIDVHASLYVKIGSGAETSYSFSSTSDEQSISIPQGASVRLRVEWDDLFYPSRLKWFNYGTSSSEGSANPYTFSLNADKYLVCSLRAG